MRSVRVYKLVAGKGQNRDHLDDLGQIGIQPIKMEPAETGHEGLGWNQLTSDSVQCWAFGNGYFGRVKWT
jgi:hypothetical protein